MKKCKTYDDDGRLVPEREIDQSDNMYLKHMDDPNWPLAVKPRPRKVPAHLISSKQVRGIRYGE